MGYKGNIEESVLFPTISLVSGVDSVSDIYGVCARAVARDDIDITSNSSNRGGLLLHYLAFHCGRVYHRVKELANR